MRRIRPGSINRIGAATFHQILEAEPETWTLFLHTRKIKQWGFIERVDRTTENGAILIRPEYYSDRDTSSHRRWWKDAPKGAEADRAPLAENAS
ncbi:MAG TPA: hypothetical protein ENK26_15180 [Gammaproteobacteria bacterium]|nr:hypothetical protein [Gammaproteobacteria bacterium]